MSGAASTGRRLEHWLARLLHYGTWVATGIVAIGLAISLLRTGDGKLGKLASALSGMRTLPEMLSISAGMHVMTVGIALFILLPIMRLILMLGMFLHQRDYRFSAIAALVLLIVAAGLLAGAV
ncbi:DUF1634 domain-containing protein [Paraburkholderia fungorum]|jgi:uncharacterized membrane protein|uniref:DUF1634 domain-containing protein n=1 Tax=Paraburkholderia fungorum TaxID=134537 RepID=UPI0004AA06C0|nr:DUF1634 domain-containing protein [Paraburkholderia fungorum]KFX66648.1 hypothetical protein KBK24_0100055 [Burkholderia sp. K24]USX04275.1 DUF1634 domain-containing protein [Paraburkholderia fungorum]